MGRSPRNTSTTEEQGRGRWGLWLALVILVAAVIRFLGLGSQSLQHDEIASVMMSGHDELGKTLAAVAGDVHPPGHFVVLHVLQHLGFTDAAVLRLPSVLFGLGSVLLTGLLGRRLFGPREGLLAATLLAVSGPAVFYSQEVRPYAMLMFAVLLTTWFWLQLMGAPGGRSRHDLTVRVGFALSALLAAYTHYFGLLVAVMQWAALLPRHERRPRGFMQMSVLGLGLLVGLVPWLPQMLTQHSRESFYIQRPGPGVIWEWFAWNYNESTLLASLALLLLAAWAAGSLRGRDADGGRLWERRWGLLLSPPVLLLALFLGPFAISFLKSQVSLPVLTMRNTIVSLPAGILLLARAAWALPLRPAARKGGVAALVVLFTGHLFLEVGHGLRPVRNQYKEAAEYVVEREPDGRALVLTCGAIFPFDFYFKRLGSDLTIGARGCREEDVGELHAAIDGAEGPRFWIVSGNTSLQPDLMRALAQRHWTAEQKVFHGSVAWLLRGGATGDRRGLTGRWRTLWGPPEGTWIRQEGPVLQVEVPENREDKVFLVCQSGPVRLDGESGVAGEWRLEDATGDVALLARVERDGGGHQLRGVASNAPGEDWGPLGGTLAVDGTVEAELCLRVNLQRGHLHVKGLSWDRTPPRTTQRGPDM